MHLDKDVIRRVSIASVDSMGRVAIICMLGGVMARFDVLNSGSRKSVAGLLTYLLQPALLFTKVSQAVDRAGARLVHWLILPAYALLHVCLGLALAQSARFFWNRYERAKKRQTQKKKLSFSPLPSTETRADDNEDCVGDHTFQDSDIDWVFAVLAMSSSFPNGGSLCYAVVDSLCATPSSIELLGGDRDTCLHATIGYVSFYLSFLSPLMWLIIPVLLASKVNTDTTAIELTMPPRRDHGPDTINSNTTTTIQEQISCLTLSKRCFSRLMKTPPPVLAAIIGAVVGGVPGLRQFLLENADEQNVLGSALTLVGESAIPIGMINLGGAIAANAIKSDSTQERKKMPTSLIIAAGFFRLLLIPFISILLTATLRAHNLFVPRRDGPLTLVLMLEAIPPPAMQCMIFVQLFNQSLERPLSHVLVSLYFFGLITLTAWIAVILSILAADAASST